MKAGREAAGLSLWYADEGCPPMKKLLVIGIGAGDPEHVTIQAIKAMNRAAVFFVFDKGEEKAALVRLRKEICERYIETPGYRFVRVLNPSRDSGEAAYKPAVRAWHRERAEIVSELIARELKDGECGAFLVWGDPTLYDSTIRVLDHILSEGLLQFDYEVVPGISSIQDLAAKHRITLNTIGEPVHITTGRRLAEGLATNADSVVVMLDNGTALATLADEDLEIYWGAYLGTPNEILISGKLADVAGEIGRQREAAKSKHGWIMDTYLLRRRPRS